jgi:prepilin-type N-terminal cleavage/methylation domain-containing protein
MGEPGFSLIETLVASAILATALVSLAELFGVSLRATAAAGNGTEAMLYAVQKMEQLRSLTWALDANGVPVSDVRADTTVSPERPTGGTGLSPSPSDTLWHTTNGYVDYLDSSGNLLGGGLMRPLRTAYVRRWSITPLSADSANTLVLQVLVTRRPGRSADQEGTPARQATDARLVSVKTRRAR